MSSVARPESGRQHCNMLSRAQRRVLQRLMLCLEQAPCAGRLPYCLHTGCVAAAGPGQQRELSGTTLAQARCPLAVQRSVPQQPWADCSLQQTSDQQQRPGLQQRVTEAPLLSSQPLSRPVHTWQSSPSAALRCRTADSLPAQAPACWRPASQHHRVPAGTAVYLPSLLGCMRGLATVTASRQQAAAAPAPGRFDNAEQEGLYGTQGPLPPASQPAGKTQRPAAAGRNPAWQRSKQFQQQRSREPSAAPPKRNAEIGGARGTGEIRLVQEDSSHEVLTVKAALQRARASNMDLVSIKSCVEAAWQAWWSLDRECSTGVTAFGLASPALCTAHDLACRGVTHLREVPALRPACQTSRRPGGSGRLGVVTADLLDAQWRRQGGALVSTCLLALGRLWWSQHTHSC